MTAYSVVKSGEEFPWADGTRVLFRQHAYTLAGRERQVDYSLVVVHGPADDAEAYLLDVPRLDRVVHGKDWILAWAFRERYDRYDVYLVVRKLDGSYVRRQTEVSGCGGTLAIGAVVDALGGFQRVDIAVEFDAASPTTTWEDFGLLRVMRWSTGQYKAA